MQRFRVVVFETVDPRRGEDQSRGGGVAFFPLDESPSWPTVVDAIVRAHFSHSVVRSVEVGIGTLDETIIAGFCRKHEGVYWQGGDRP